VVRLVCIVEVEAATNIEEAQVVLDNFREAAQPNDHGISLYRATEAGADAAYYASDVEDDA